MKLKIILIRPERFYIGMCQRETNNKEKTLYYAWDMLIMPIFALFNYAFEFIFKDKGGNNE